MDELYGLIERLRKKCVMFLNDGTPFSIFNRVLFVLLWFLVLLFFGWLFHVRSFLTEALLRCHLSVACVPAGASFAVFLFFLLSLHWMREPGRTKAAVLTTFIFSVLIGTVR